ncbi:methyltransferase domain-containing protein [Primorskyibacter aestuariivivens]|uniref:class I SAM-dependent methyltransferase n=1 Tax=Primorskyibacter aestuariivivens TaxID=1888912 RepID=UPI0022FFDEF6|nr:class I SAM-dependent methyltransferase [Primorskyibacter aestuariivivens]MDA7430532.1 methyltransferase domain-containing protein [Primorskyibacter aestuariivivens]
MTKLENMTETDVWGTGGAAYDPISFGLSDGIGHAVQKLCPAPGEKVLDLGTGTGWAARLVAGLGADVTGLDMSEPMIRAARELSAHLETRLRFRKGAAEALPFDDATFDGVISTYGVMFASQPDRAISEMARVLRPGGRMALTTWAETEGYIADFFAVIGHHSDAPPPEASPFDWGNEDWLRDHLGRQFDISVEPLTTTYFAPDAATVWHKYRQGFGPVRATYDALPPDRAEAFRADFIAMQEHYAGASGLRITRKALLVSGRRR